MAIDVGAAEAALDVLASRLQEATRAAVAEALALVTAKAMKLAPVRTGALRRSILPTPVVQVGPGRWAGRTGPTVVYGRIRELGGHIYPHGHPFLRWEGPNGPIYARHVYQTGRPYLKPAVDATDLRAIAGRHWGDAIRSV